MAVAKKSRLVNKKKLASKAKAAPKSKAKSKAAAVVTRAKATVQDVKKQAMELVRQAEGRASSERKKLAEKAAKLFPDCTEAWTILGELETSPQKKIEIFQRAVDSGIKVLGKAFLRSEESLAHEAKAQPFLAALYALSNALWNAGKRQEAVEKAMALIEWCPEDTHGARFQLLHWFAILKDERAKELVKFYSDETSAWWQWGKVLASSALKIDFDKQLRKALNDNDYVGEFLLELKKAPKKIPSIYMPGHESEAAVYASEFKKYWSNKDVLNKLKTVYRSVTKE